MLLPCCPPLKLRFSENGMSRKTRSYSDVTAKIHQMNQFLDGNFHYKLYDCGCAATNQQWYVHLG